MNDLQLIGVKEHWTPFKAYGFQHSFLYVTRSTLLATWFIMGAIIALIIAGRFFLRKKESRIRYLLLLATESFMNICQQTLGTFEYNHFSFIFALFIFILFCNIVGVIPELEEPTADLSTTLGLALVSFIYIQYYTIQAHGIKAYIADFFHPFFIMFPVNIIGKLSSIISLSFRLFGNLLGGSIISTLFFNVIGSHWIVTLAGLTGLNLIITFFFGIFEGAIQAFVFSVLSLTYLSLGIQGEHSEEA